MTVVVLRIECCFHNCPGKKGGTITAGWQCFPLHQRLAHGFRTLPQFATVHTNGSHWWLSAWVMKYFKYSVTLPLSQNVNCTSGCQLWGETMRMSTTFRQFWLIKSSTNSKMPSIFFVDDCDGLHSAVIQNVWNFFFSQCTWSFHHRGYASVEPTNTHKGAPRISHDIVQLSYLTCDVQWLNKNVSQTYA
jgi:hypothetical protein